MVRQTWVLSYFPFAIYFFTTKFLIFVACHQVLINSTVLGLHKPSVSSAAIFLAAKEEPACCTVPAIPVSEEATETIWHVVNAVLACQSIYLILTTFLYFHYFSPQQRVPPRLALVASVFVPVAWC